MPAEYAVVPGDVFQLPADLLLLKYAQGFHGADAACAAALERRGVCAQDELRVAPGAVVVRDTGGAIAARQVMYIGTPTLSRFRYKEMREFAQRAIRAVARLPGEVRSILTTVHGAGYGLDVEEALQALLFGFQIGQAQHQPPALERITFVERNARRANTIAAALSAMLPAKGTPDRPSAQPSQPGPAATAAVAPLPAPAKLSAFVAMPFSQDFEDVYEFGIYAPIRRCGYVCERVDESAFAGNIVDRIQEGIREARFMVADLTGERPNVYLEVGYAWGLQRPVILVARAGQKLHFDLSHHRCIFYTTIGKLGSELERLVREMFGPGS